MTLFTDAGRTLGYVFRDAGRVLAAHWPALIGWFLVGWAGRMSILWAVTSISDWSPTLAVLLLPFAPMCTLLSLVLMMRVAADTLPAFADMMASFSLRDRVRDNLTVAGQVLIPFLAVYASAGLLRQDVRVFLYDSTADEFINANIQSMDFGRANYAEGWTLFALIVGAVVLRKMISILDLPKRHLAWAGAAVYLEILWMITLVNALTTTFEDWRAWLENRRVIAAVLDWWDVGYTWLRQISDPVTNAVDATAAFLGSLGAVALVPVAWLGIGAAVYGQRLAGSTLSVQTHEDVTKRIQQVPQPVRRVVAQAVEPVTTPVRQTFGAIGKIAAAGIIPMVLFCVVFVVASTVQVGVAMLMRQLVGPGPNLRQFALEPYAVMVERGAYFVLVLALLGAAVSRVVIGQRERETADEVPTPV